MLRDNLVGLIEPMCTSAGVDPLALCLARQMSSDDRPPCLENPRPEGAESTLTGKRPSPFHAEPRHNKIGCVYNELQILVPKLGVLNYVLGRRNYEIREPHLLLP